MSQSVNRVPSPPLMLSPQMTPKLRPSFPDAVMHLEDILAKLKAEEMERDHVSLGGDNEIKAMPKGNKLFCQSINIVPRKQV